MNANAESIEAVLSFVLNAEYEESQVQLLLASSPAGTDGETVLEKMQITKEVADEFREGATREIRKWRKRADNGDIRLLGYDPAALNRPDEVEWLSLGEEPEIAEQLTGHDDIASLPLFTAEKSFVDNLRFYILTATVGEVSVAFFRRYGRANELTRSSYFGVRLSNTVFGKIHEPTFLFDHHFDCVLFQETLFVLNKNNFQQIFRYFERVKAAGRQALRTISARVPIANFDAFAALCEGQLHMLAKLKNIAAKEYLQRVTMKDIKKVIREFGLPAQIVRRNGTEQLLFEPDSKDKWLILRILDDDYLGSVMTKLRYEANSKRPL